MVSGGARWFQERLGGLKKTPEWSIKDWWWFQERLAGFQERLCGFEVPGGFRKGCVCVWFHKSGYGFRKGRVVSGKVEWFQEILWRFQERLGGFRLGGGFRKDRVVSGWGLI